MMTQLLLQELGAEHEVELLDRRFSSSVSEVGKPTLGKVLRVPSLLWRAWTLSRRKSFVSVIFATNRIGSFLVDLAVTSILASGHERIVLYLHSNGWSSLAGKSATVRYLVRRLFALADAVVVLGPALTEDVSQFIEMGTPTVVIPNAVEPPAVEADGGRSGRQVLFLSNLLPEKGAHDFVEIAALIHSREPDTRFVLAGASVDEVYSFGLRKRVQALEMDGAFRFPGAVKGQEKWTLLRESDVLIFPSTYAFEAQPLVIVEALSVGTPVVAYDTGGISDCVRDGITGFLVRENHIEAASEFSVRILRGEANHLSVSSVDYWKSHHSISSFRSRWHQVIASLVR